MTASTSLPNSGAARDPARPPVGARPPARPRILHVPWWSVALTALVAVTALVYVVLDLVTSRGPSLAPRHRAEALCFALAQPPPFTPAMAVQPSAALVRGRFNANTPAAFALQEMMGFGDERILRQWSQHVGDFDVSAFWLRLPGPENEHWLVVAWMEGADLAVCNFRFTGTSRVLSAEEKAWGVRLLRRILVAPNFHRDALPDARLHVAGGRTMPVFGPVAKAAG